MKWKKIDFLDSESQPPQHDLVWVCYEDDFGVKRYDASRFVSNDFPRGNGNVWWAKIKPPKN